MRRSWLLLAFAIALVLWLWRSPREEVSDNQAEAHNRATEPGYVATDAWMWETDDAGQPKYRLRAERVVESDPQANIELTAPQFTYEGETIWTLTARTGVLPPSAQQITLTGDVLAQGDKPGSPTMHIRTNSLNVDMAARHADTADPVAMDWGSNKLWSHGMQADMQTDHLRLLSPVYGEFTRARNER
jgi:LPS export ABC transporter protein LptC